jgi:uncharacterized repeat protein (TIGR03803 family)
MKKVITSLFVFSVAFFVGSAFNAEASSYTKKYDFSENLGSYPSSSLVFNGGKFYGTTQAGGANDFGVIFEWNPNTNVYIKKIDFNGLSGGHPSSDLTFKDGKFYGVTSNLGTIFEWNPSTNMYITKFNFDDFSNSDKLNGFYPMGPLVLKDGKFYGLTLEGGSNNVGVIFEWNPTTNVFTKKFDFNEIGGSKPQGPLTLKDGKFYGVTQEGGNNNLGTIFEWNPTTNAYIKKIDFSNNQGGVSYSGSLTLKDGKFYGMTFKGGENDKGVIFEWDPTTNVYIKKIDFSDNLGIYPFSSLVIKDGKFYGMTSQGGLNARGVIFEWDPVTNIYIKKYDFSEDSGILPVSSLYFREGKFYGMTQSGGVNKKGVIFEFYNTNETIPTEDFAISGVSGPQNLGVGEKGEWEVRAYSKNADNLSFDIDWGDDTGSSVGQIESSNLSLPKKQITQTEKFVHIYSKVGHYTITVIVNNTSGGSAKTSLTVNVLGAENESKFGGYLSSVDNNINMWGTHVLKNYVIYECVTSSCPSASNPAYYSISANNSSVLSKLNLYKNMSVTIYGQPKWYNINNGFWGIEASDVILLPRTLKVGTKGEDVKSLQKFLEIKADGIFGKGTATKVKNWQIKNGLTPDGSFGIKSYVKAGLLEE